MRYIHALRDQAIWGPCMAGLALVAIGVGLLSIHLVWAVALIGLGLLLVLVGCVVFARVLVISSPNYSEVESNTRRATGGTNEIINTGTMQIGRDLFVGTANTHVPEAKPPSVSVRGSGDCCWLSLTNNDVADNFVVEVSQFQERSGLRLRPKRENGETVGSLKRGEQVWVCLLRVEPERPHLIHYSAVVAATRLHYIPWKARIDRGVRLVRFYGDPDRDVEIAANGGGSFTVSVLSDRHAPVTERVTYGVTEQSRLLVPFDAIEIQRVNAEDTAEFNATIEALAGC